VGFPLKIGEIVEAIDLQTDETTAFLNKRTGEIVTILAEEIDAVANQEPLEDAPEWERGDMRIAQEILGNEGDFLRLPTKDKIDEYQIMERFCLSVRDRKILEGLYVSIKGKGAFRRFKDQILRLGIADQWYKYREEAIKQIAIDWCKSHRIDFEEE
jgi:hypothetical protein